MTRAAPLRLLGLWLAVLVLAGRLAVPTGWMPASDRSFSLMLCQGGTMQMTVAHDGTHHDAPEQAQPCDFALAAAGRPAVPASDISAQALLTAAALLLPFPAAIVPGRGLAAPPPPSRGPPAIP